MNEKAKRELIRQLVEGARYFARCGECGMHFQSEYTHDTCPSDPCTGKLFPDREGAERYYCDLIEHAERWGER